MIMTVVTVKVALMVALMVVLMVVATVMQAILMTALVMVTAAQSHGLVMVLLTVKIRLMVVT